MAAVLAADDSLGRDAAERKKAEGARLLKAKLYGDACRCWEEAVALLGEGKDAADREFRGACHSNRSMALLRQGEHNAACDAARRAIAERPGWWKAHTRLNAALLAGERYVEAAAACEAGLQQCGETKQLRKALQESRAHAEAAAVLQRLRGAWWGEHEQEDFGTVEHRSAIPPGGLVRPCSVHSALTCVLFLCVPPPSCAASAVSAASAASAPPCTGFV